MINKVLDLKKNEILEMAVEAKSSLRIPDKLLSDKMLEAFCMCSVHTECSLNIICAYLFNNFDIDITKQGLVKRVNREGTVKLFEEVLKSYMLKSINDRTDLSSLKNKFGRILLQDSTTIQLPNRLYEIFHGIENAKSTKTFMRIQAVYDVFNKNFEMFSLNPYKENDLASAPNIDIHDKDLWIRDRGYFALDSCKKITEEGGAYILRYKAYTTLFKANKDANGKKTQLDLIKELKKKKRLKLKVLVGAKCVPMYLIAEPVSDTIASERRRKAKSKNRYETGNSSKKGSKKGTKKGTKNKKTMTKEYSFLCGFTIYLVSVDVDLNFKEIFALYALRWRIEVIFKTWKSHLNFNKIHNASTNQLYVIMYSKLIMSVITYTKFYNSFLTPVFEASGKLLSILSLVKHLSLDFKHYLKLLIAGKTETLIYKFAKSCTYDKRKRKNYLEMENEIFRYLDYYYSK